MKICPHCQNTYTDDTLQYCLQDGSPLANYAPSGEPTSKWSEPETLVSPRERMRIDTQNSPSQNWQQDSQVTQIKSPQPEPQKSNSLKVVLLTMLGMFVLFGLGGIGAWVIYRNSRTEVVTNTNTNANTKPTNTKPQNSSNANQSSNANSNSQTNTNANANTNVNVATPTPKPTINPAEAAQAKKDIGDVVDDWQSAAESHDLDYSLNNYADTVDYYNAGKVGLGRVRADKQRAFDTYSSMDFNISNLKVTLDDTGKKATVVFDKEWNFENDEKTNSGKVQQQLQFAKFEEQWKIVGEKDLKVYYVNK